MGSYWGADGKLVDGRFEIVAGSVADGQTLWTPGMLFNETTSDKPRGNTQGTLLASAARTTGTPSANQINYNAKGVHLTLNISAVPAAPGTGGLYIQIYELDSISGAIMQLNTNLASPFITVVGAYAVELYPGATTATPGTGNTANALNQRTSGSLPKSWFARVVHNDAQSYTYSLAYALIL